MKDIDRSGGRFGEERGTPVGRTAFHWHFHQQEGGMGTCHADGFPLAGGTERLIAAVAGGSRQEEEEEDEGEERRKKKKKGERRRKKKKEEEGRRWMKNTKEK